MTRFGPIELNPGKERSRRSVLRAGGAGPVGIPRTGRASFVAFELGSDGLRELPVEAAEDGLTLRIRCKPSTGSPEGA